MRLRELREERDARLGEAETMLAKARAETRDLTELETAAFDATKAEVRRIEREIEIEETRASAARGAPARTVAGGDREPAFAEFRSILRGETRAMSSASGAEGGHLVPEEIDRIVQSQLVDISPMRRLARVVSTSTADYKVLVNVRGGTSGWAGEATSRAATDTPELEQIAPPSGELWAYPSVSNWLLDDALVDVPAFLSENVTTEFAFREGLAFLTGDGSNKPKGFLTYDTAATADATRDFGDLQHVATGQASALPTTAVATVDKLIDLVTALRPAYRQGPGVAWVMNSTTAAVLRKLKDAENRLIWAEPLTAGTPSMLLGHPVVEMEGMPDIGTNALPIAFGNFAFGYRIIDRTGLRVIRDEVTTPGWTKWYFARRVGGAVVDSNAIKLLKCAAS
jgi:HK97 family phage major capsid protein